MARKTEGRKGYGFGTFQGVFTPSILTIIGVVMYLRFGWVLGNVGLAGTLLIVTIGSSITFLTGLSISALASNMRMKGGGAYYMLSRSLGVEAGAALGIPLALSQAICVSFYVSGFAESLVGSGVPLFAGLDVRVVGVTTLAAIAVVSTLSANLALKMQYLIMAAIAASLVSFFLGSAPPVAAESSGGLATLGFWPVFAVFFPAVTGILSGLGMSGDLKDPGKSIPRGTIAAVLVGYAVYMAVPVGLYLFVPDRATLLGDNMVFLKCARWQGPILAGIWAATLSSAIGSFLAAPRVVQALSRDRIVPPSLGRGFGRSDDPYFASILCFGLAAAGIWFGGIDSLAPVLTLVNLSVYGLLNFCAAMEGLMSSPSWRPAFKVRSSLSVAGFLLCLAAMLMISPAWTFVALAVELVVFWTAKRRDLKASWGDMRGGIYAQIVAFALRKLVRKKVVERNWRPNLLVLSRLPVQNSRIFDFARGVTLSGGSLVTVASVLPPGIAGSERESEIRDSLLRAAAKSGLRAYVKLVGSPSVFGGIAELIRTYGFGPVSPNTVVFGAPLKDHCCDVATSIMIAASLKKNVVIVGEPDKAVPSIPGKYVDVWWRGGGANAGLLLALAWLLDRKSNPMRVNTIVAGRTREEAQAELDGFLKESRINAVTRVFEAAGADCVDIIIENSTDAALTLAGLRHPEEGESAGEYAAYFSAVCDALPSIPSPVLVLAGEDVDFRRIFN